MHRRTLGTLVLSAIAALVAITVVQVLWLKRAQRYQLEQVTLQQQQHSQLDKEFSDRAKIALSAVTERILSITKDPSDLFDAVKQERPNYFAVTINDTIHPYLLESLLKQEFKRRGIDEDFEYGIYDCFTDSIVYGNYVSLSDSLRDPAPGSGNLLKLDKDGHYFGVNFPARGTDIWQPEAERVNWLYSAVVSLIVFVFFSYSIWVVLRQKRLEEMKDDFIANMTHELKTPISTIGLSADVLLDPAIVSEPERLLTYADIIRTENERLRVQVDRVLQLGRSEREHLFSNAQAVDMHALAQRSLQRCAVLFNERQGSTELTVQSGHCIVIGNGEHLASALDNLLDNALKYGGSPPAVQVTIARQGALLRIAVRDNGIGIAPDDLQHIFKRFFRAHTGNLHDVKGFGLGLHYAQQVARAHNGRISVESIPGKGSTFILHLPLAPNNTGQ